MWGGLLLTLLLSFTGYLLPWDQLAIWAITVGSNMARATPILGHEGPGQQLLNIGGLDLITNASDALKDANEPKINIRATRHNSLIALIVEDNGCGISKEAQANLFKPFYTTKPRGTGLGLMMALKMVMLMKGNMEIKSVKNKGTRVTFFIPDGRKENAQS